MLSGSRRQREVKPTMTLGEMVARISAQNSALKQTIRESKSEIKGFVDHVQAGRQKLRDWNETVDKGATRLRNFGLATGVAATGVVTFLSKLTTARSDAVETQNKFEQVFKHLTAETNEWALNFAKAVGRSRTDVRNWLADLQDTFVPLGFVREKAAEMSKSLVETAVHVGSFKNMADAEVLRDFGSAIVGNHEAVRRYGIVITEAEMKQEAWRMGIQYSSQETDAATKAQIRYNIILRATADAHGDAIRTAEEYANMQKRVQARAKDLAETVGAGLLPIGKEIQKVVLGVIDATETWILQNKGAAARVITLVVAITALLGAFALLATGGFVVAKVIVALGTVFSTLTSWPLLAVAAIVALAWAWSNNFLGMKDAAQTFWDKVGPIVDKILSLERKTIRTLWQWAVQGLDWVSLTFIPWLSDLPETLENRWKWVVEGLADLRDAAALAVARTVEWAINLKQRWTEKVAGWDQKVSDWLVGLRQRWDATVDEWSDKATSMAVNLRQRWTETVSEWKDRIANFRANLNQVWASTVAEWPERAVSFAANLKQRWAEAVDEWRDRVVNFRANLNQVWNATVDEWKEKAVGFVANLRQRWSETVDEYGDRIVTFAARLNQKWGETVSEWKSRIVDFTANLRQRWSERVDEWRTKAVDFVANLRQRWAETVSEWDTKVTDLIVNLKQTWLVKVAEWEAKATDFIVRLRQTWAETVEGWRERVVEWQVRLRSAAEAVSATVQVWLDNAKYGVTWVVNLAKGAAVNLAEWIGDKVDIVANLVRLTAEKASAGAQWLLGLIEGRAEAAGLETTVDVDATVDVNPTPKEGLGTKIDNWLKGFFEGLQWVEISREEFGRLREELGEQADEMLKAEGDKFYVRSSEKINLLVDFALGVGNWIVGGTVLHVITAAVDKLWKSAILGHIFKVALAAAVVWSLTPEPIKDALKQSLEGLGIEIGEENEWIVTVAGITLSVATWFFILKPLLAAMASHLAAMKAGILGATAGPAGLVLTVAALAVLSIGWLLRDRPGAELADQMAELEQKMRWFEQQIEITVDSEKLEHLKQSLDEARASYGVLVENMQQSAIEVDYRLQQKYPGLTFQEIVDRVAERGHELVEQPRGELRQQLDALRQIALDIENEGGIVHPALRQLIPLLEQADAQMRSSHPIPEDQYPHIRLTRWAQQASEQLQASGDQLAASVDSVADIIDRVSAATGVPAALLSGIGVAEGFPEKARFGVLSEGMSTDFKKNAEELTRALFGEGHGLQSTEFQATAAALSAQGYWERYKAAFQEERDLTLAELEGETQEKFVEFMHAGYAPEGAENDPTGLNRFWKDNVLSIWTEIRTAMDKFGYDSIKEFVDGVRRGEKELVASLSQSTLDFLTKAHLVFDAIENDRMAQTWGSDLSENLVIGVEDGMERELPQIRGAMAKVKETLLAGWDKLPDWVQTPIQDLIKLIEEKLLPLTQMVEESLAEMEGSAEELKRIAAEAQALADKVTGDEDNPLTALPDMVDSFTEGFGQGLQEAEGYFTVIGSFFSKLKIDMDSISEKGLRLGNIFKGWKEALMGVAIDGLNVLGNALSRFFTGFRVAGDRYGKPAQLAIGEMVKRFREWDENAKKLEELRKQQAGYTVGGAVAGGIAGWLLSSILGPFGWLIGAGVGAAVGHQAGQAALGEQIKELEEKLQTTRESIKEILKITISDFAGGLQQAFDSIDVKSFGRNFGRFIDETIRNAMIAAFVGSKAIQEKLEALSNFVFDKLVNGELGADAIAQAREMGKDIVEAAKPFFEAMKELFPGLGSDAGESTSAGTVVTHVSGKLRDQLLDIFRPVSAMAQRLPGYIENMPSLLERIANTGMDIRDILSTAVVPSLQASAAGVGGITINFYDAKFSESYTMRTALDDVAEYLGAEIAETSESRGVR